MTSLLSAVAGFITREVLQYITGLIKSWIAKREQAQADHQAATDQAAKDNEKAGKIDETSKSQDVDAAIDDSLNHL